MHSFYRDKYTSLTYLIKSKAIFYSLTTDSLTYINQQIAHAIRNVYNNSSQLWDKNLDTKYRNEWVIKMLLKFFQCFNPKLQLFLNCEGHLPSEIILNLGVFQRVTSSRKLYRVIDNDDNPILLRISNNKNIKFGGMNLKMLETTGLVDYA
ncbi:hypothetical protein QTP88_014549 [Uroleucon formosanum]